MAEAPLNEREHAVWRAFAAVSRHLLGAVEQRLQGEAGISVSDFEILDALGTVSGGRARAGELADMLSWEKSRISHHVSRMESRGLVERLDCDTDLRGTWVTATALGYAALARATPAYAAEIRTRFASVLDREAEDAIIRASRAILRSPATQARDAPTA